MRILGIDPGSIATGWGMVVSARGGSSLEYLAHGTLRTSRDASLPVRLASLHRGIVAVIEQFEPEEAGIERVFMARNSSSALVLGQARGAAMAALGSAGLAVTEVAAREVKQQLTGTGAASKAQIQRVVADLFELASLPQADAADALAVAICVARRSQLAKLGVRRRSTRRARSAAEWSAGRVT